jgi:hypothetical protein
MRHAISNRSKQNGQALLAMVIIFIAASAYVLVTKLNANARQYSNQSSNQAVLNEARAALIGYALNFPEIDATSPGDPINGPGYLPCPDKDNDGDADSPCALAGPTNFTIGRFPYKSLEVSELRDSSGARLWYALSENYRNNPQLEPLNSEIPGQLTVNGNGDIVAVIIAPGAPLGNQNRDPTDTTITTEIANYLETENNDLDLDFNSIDPSVIDVSDFNDRLITLTRQELMAVIEKRVLGEVKKVLAAYKTTHNAYPWLSPFADPKAVARKLSGFADAGSSSTVLNDSANNFTTRGVAIGDVVYNLTDGSIGAVSSVAANVLGITGLALGTDNDFDEDDEYVVIAAATQTVLTSTSTSAGDKDTLNDNSRNLNNIGVAVSDVIENRTDGSSAIVTSISANSIEVDALIGGADNLFQLGDAYQIRSNYGVATNAAQSATQLDDTNKSFITMGVQAGDIVRNLTDGSFGTITTVNATSLVVDQLDFGINNLFSVGDNYSVARYNAASGTREGLLSLHEVGELFPTSFGLDWNVGVLNAGDIVFDTAAFPSVEAAYRMAELYLQNYAIAGSLTIDDAKGFCIWSVADIADCYGYFRDYLSIDGRLTSGNNDDRIYDTAATLVTDNVKRGDIVQNYDDEITFISGTAKALADGTATSGSTGSILEDTTKVFTAINISIGDEVTNNTDGSTGIIVSISTDSITVSTLSGGTDNIFTLGDDYDIYHSDRSKLYDTANDFSSLIPYSYMIHNNTQGARALLANVVDTDTLETEDYTGSLGTAINFNVGDSYTVYAPRNAVVDYIVSQTVLDTDQYTAYNPDFDANEYYRVVSAGNSFSGTVDDEFEFGEDGALAVGQVKMQDDSADFISEGVTIGDVIYVPERGDYFGEILAVTATTITTTLYGGNGHTRHFHNDDDYIIFHDYVYSREHVFHTKYSGNQATNTVAQERVRDVCVGYNVACTATTAAVNFSGNGGVPFIRVRDYEADGTTEVGRADFTPSSLSSGDLRVSNIDYYLNDITGDIPSWFINNDWHKLVYVAYSAGDAPGAAAACVAGTNCLTINSVDNTGAPVVKTINNNALVVSAGMEISTTLDSNCNNIVETVQNRSSGTINEYYELDNCNAGDDAFQQNETGNFNNDDGNGTVDFNDQVRVIEP